MEIENRPFSITVKDSFGQVTISEEVSNLLDSWNATKKDLEEKEKELRSAILVAMIENSIFSSKVGKWQLSQVVPKDIETFNEDQFILDMPEEVVKAYTKIDTTETFDTVGLLAKYPEIYKEFNKVDYVTAVDTKKLAKALPEVYNKYVTKTPSEKPITLRIAESK